MAIEDIQGSALTEPEQWLARYGDELYRYAVMRLRDTALSEDMVQETLLAALQSHDSYAGQSSARTWLIGILKHKILDHLRRSGRERPLDLGAYPGEDTAAYFDETGHWQAAPGDWGEPEKELEQEQFWKAFQDCLGRLPERLRVLYSMKEVDGMATEEVLEILNISTANNLWVMMSRARVHLRQCLETNWIDK